MKILLFGKYSRMAGFLQRGFESLEHDVLYSAAGSVESNHATSSATHSESVNVVKDLKNSQPIIFAQRALRRLQRLSFPLRLSRMVTETQKLIRDFQPDVVFTCQGGMSMLLPPEILETFNDQNVPVFTYFTDPVPEDNSEFLATIPQYAGIFTYNRNYVPTWYWYGAQQVNYAPFASDPIIHVPKEPDPDRFDYYHSPISYLGTWKPHAELWPVLLVPYGLKIWGNQWYKLPANHSLRNTWQGEGKGLHEEFALICATSNIVFNVVQAFSGQGHSMKTFEIPACRGFALTNRTEEQLEFFPEDEACVYFSTAEELIDKTEFYLKNKKKREKIVDKAYQIAKQHRYVDRARDMVSIFQEVL